MKKEITEKNLVPIKKNVSTAVESSNSLQIVNVEGIKKASDILNGIAAILKNIKTEKNRIVSPAKEIIAWAKEKFGPLEKECEEAETIIKKKMVDFDKKEEERKKKELDKISEKALTGKIDIDKIPEKIKELESVNSYSGEEGGSIQFRELKKVSITDITRLPLRYLVPNEKMIKDDLLAGLKVPGAEIVIEKIVARGK